MERPSTPGPFEAYARTYRERVRVFLGRIAHRLLSDEESQDHMSRRREAVLEAGEIFDDVLEAQVEEAMVWFTAFLRDIEAGTLPAALADAPFLQEVPYGEIRRVICDWRNNSRDWLTIAAEATEKIRRLGYGRIQYEGLMRYCAAVPIREAELREYLATYLDRGRRP